MIGSRLLAFRRRLTCGGCSFCPNAAGRRTLTSILARTQLITTRNVSPHDLDAARLPSQHEAGQTAARCGVRLEHGYHPIRNQEQEDKRLEQLNLWR
jgi:hypothetical protein